MLKGLPEEIINRIATEGSLKELYTHFRLFKNLSDENREIYNQVRNGINIEFDIYDEFENKFHKKPKSQKIVIYGTEMDLKEYRNELEEREDLLRESIYSLMISDDIMQGRQETN